MNKMFDKMNKKFDIMNTMFDFTNKMFLFLKFTCFGNMIRISRPDTNSSNIPKKNLKFSNRFLSGTHQSLEIRKLYNICKITGTTGL